MADVSSGRGVKRNMASDVVPPPSNSSQVTLLSPSLLLLGIPPDTDTSLPVWDAVRSQRVHVTWSVNAYSVGVRLTPATSDRARDASSGGREGASIAAWTSALSLTTQQQSDASQCPPSALLTFSQTGTHVSPCPPQMIPPNPTTSLIVPLPLIISQRQPPRQPGAKTRKLAVIRTPAPAPPRPPAPPKPPVPCPFHTRSSSDVDICDRFLLGLCRAGGRCRKHHTPFPYHWQLMCSLTDMWVSISPRFQVLLERSYCDAAQEVVSIEDGHVSCTVFFESMELDELSRYGGVRRLSNSDRNPYFPSRWKIYWLNDSGWEEYKKDVSELLMKTVAELEPECSFFMGLQEYKLDFTTMTQTHVSTGLQREVRCRPVFRSPESMQPYLQLISWSFTGPHTQTCRFLFITLTSFLPLLPTHQDGNPARAHQACRGSARGQLQRGPPGGVQLLVSSGVVSGPGGGVQPGRRPGGDADPPQGLRLLLPEPVGDQGGGRQHPAGPEPPALGQVPKAQDGHAEAAHVHRAPGETPLPRHNQGGRRRHLPQQLRPPRVRRQRDDLRLRLLLCHRRHLVPRLFGQGGTRPGPPHVPGQSAGGEGECGEEQLPPPAAAQPQDQAPALRHLRGQQGQPHPVCGV
ncbi:uncharacterized protein LOC133949119 isoform X1 [Platichthys flesus]|uniref:uncharacterized protein LOC133949119 isoform X1 n=1 Tax=Platichthys flesus TaxID=8260 RepID=UPI002DBCED1E|nr:uncharacterized protein LOC133949119 isoform X1 [Platichthys flesus]